MSDATVLWLALMGSASAVWLLAWAFGRVAQWRLRYWQRQHAYWLKRRQQSEARLTEWKV